MARNSKTFRYLENLWIHAGGNPHDARIMAAIAMAESGGDPRAHNPSGATGLWQILGAVRPQDQSRLYNPEVNAREAVLKLRDQGFGAWTTYTSGAYRQYMDLGHGVGGAGFVSPVAKGATFERVDQGVDYMQREPYVAIGNGTVYAIGSGFRGGSGKAVYIRLDHPITVNGRTYDEVYYAETNPLVRVGQHVHAGEAVASGGAAELGFAQGARPMAQLVGGYGAGTQASMQGHDFLDVVQKNPNVQISVGGAPSMNTVTASHHQEMGLTDNGLGAGFATLPDEGVASNSQPVGPDQQQGATGLFPLQAMSPIQASNIWQEIAAEQNSSPETMTLAANAQNLTANTPSLLR